MHNHLNGNELRILMQMKLISLTIVEHKDSLRNRDKHQLENGLFYYIKNWNKNNRVGTSFAVQKQRSQVAKSNVLTNDNVNIQQ